MFCGIADRLGEALAVAIVDAAVFKVADHVTTEFVETVFFVDDEFGVDLLGIISKTIATGFVFYVWMNVGIIPKKRRLNALGS